MTETEAVLIRKKNGRCDGDERANASKDVSVSASFGRETAAGDVWSQEGLTRIQTLSRWFQGLRDFA